MESNKINYVHQVYSYRLKFNVLVVLVAVWLPVLTVTGANDPSPGDFGENVPSSTFLDKLMNSRLIIEPLEQGSETVKIIVNLTEPEGLKASKDRKRTLTLKEKQLEVAAAEDSILSGLDSQDFRVRHIFDNQAAFSGEVTPTGLVQLMTHPRVESIEPVYMMELHTAQGIPLINAVVSRETYNGQGVAIAVIDDGIDYRHPKLGNGGFPNSKVIGGYDLGEDDDDPFPGFYDGNRGFHGTGAAGIAAGDFGDFSDYFGGVAYGAKLYAVKVAASDGSLDSDTVTKAIDWCVTHKNDDSQHPILVISLSLGHGRYQDPNFARAVNPSLARAVGDAVAAGITVLASSGNDGFCDSIAVPAALPDVISVGAVYDENVGRYPESGFVGVISPDSCIGDICDFFPGFKCFIDRTTAADRVPTYSNSAPILDIFAPATKTYTTDVLGPEGANSGHYTYEYGGTSAACPYAAGSVACLQTASMIITGKYLSPTEVRDRLAVSGDSVTDSKPSPDIIKPRINLGNAIKKLDVSESDLSVLVCGADDDKRMADIQERLLETGQFADVSVMDVRTMTPTLAELHAFDAVMVYKNDPYHNATALGNVMADYVDGGGGVVCMIFEAAIKSSDTSMNGRWEDEVYFAIPRSVWKFGHANLGTVYDSAHPVMQGVASFDGGTDSYRPYTFDIATDAVRIADWSDGRPLVVTKMIGNVRRVDLGFYPPSSLHMSGFWDASTDGARLMANALTWVAPLPTTIFEDTFVTTTIDTNKWTAVSNATVDDVGIDEPSASYALRLNGEDSIQSRMIDLSSYSGVTLMYYYQRTGGGDAPDSDDDLIIEYTTDGSNCVELDRQLGSGPNMNTFESAEIDLPSGALNSDFQLLFRSVGDPPDNGDWFVDDITLSSKP